MPYTGWTIQPNWETAVKIKYKFLTRIYSSYEYKEQRLPVIDIPKISMDFNCTDYNKNIANIKTTDTFIFPIYTNPMVGAKTGVSKINITTTLNFKDNAKYLIDENGYYADIGTIVGQDINLSTAWAGVASGFYYFGFAGVIAQISKQILCRQLVKFDITAEEL